MTTSFTASGRLAPRPPFDFAKTLAFLNGFTPGKSEQSLTETTLTRAVLIEGQPVAFRLTSSGTLEQPRLDYTLYADQPITPRIQTAAEDRIRFWLSLDDDLTPLYTAADDDPVFSPILRQLYGYHHVKFITPFDAGVWAILSQRNLMTVARRMKDALAAAFGGAIRVDGHSYPAPADAARLSLAAPDEAAEVIHHQAKGALLPGLARAFDSIDELWLREAPTPEVERWLKTIHGIGEWSATFILLRGLGRMDRLPRGDKRILEVVGRAYGLPLGVDDTELARLAAPYGDQAGYWAHYLRVAG